MIKGDKIKLVKPMGEFTNVGEVCEVVKVDEDGVISFRFGRNRVHLGCMSYNEFEKYFELVEKEEPKKSEWSEWSEYWISYTDFDDTRRTILISERDNGKKVQIKGMVRNKLVKSEATCHKDDKFLIAKGSELARRRLIVKILKYKTEQYAKNM